ncbi:MAG: gamma-glutamyl-gamma-aminobutyrate hydrolase family protein [Schwartzia sp.]|nr:gamma-glutamyl-gamma-aminobutyrate hydrolase family protein [Schwartzia sp. (in: firmicutes)]
MITDGKETRREKGLTGGDGRWIRVRRFLLALLLGFIVGGFGSTALAKAPVIGIAWRPNLKAATFVDLCRSVEAAGGVCVVLDQVLSPDLSYDDDRRLTKNVTEAGILDAAGAKLVRCNTWHGSNAADAVRDVDFVMFPGGEDISPTLYYRPEPWFNNGEDKDFSAERDVSDYLLMTYCLDHDIPLLAICRGMQMLSVVSGAEFAQDIPAYFRGMGRDHRYEHRAPKPAPGANRGFARHDVTVLPGSRLYEMAETGTLRNVPSWHHQCVRNVDNTRLAVTGIATTDGVELIEAVERTDKTFAVGLQFHPETAIGKNLDDAADKDDFLPYDTAMALFTWIVEEAYAWQREAA